MNIVHPGSATVNVNGVLLPADVHLRGPSLADDRMLDGNRHLDDVLPGVGERFAGQAVAVDSNQRRLGDPTDRHSNQL